MKKFPNAFVIIIAVILLSWILTYIIPQGTYKRVANEESGLIEVVNNSYQRINIEHLSAFDLILAIPRGIIGRADIIVLILLLGGCFYIIEKTGALSQGLGKLVELLKGKETLALIIVSALFTAAGATIGLQEEVIAMTPILLLFGRSLGYNTFTTVYMSYGSTVVGSAFSPSNPFAVIIAQKEAGLPLLSGSEFRLIVLLVAFVLWVLYLINYGNRNRVKKEEMTSDNQSVSGRNQIILFLLCITFGVVTYGMLELEWGFNELSASFFALGIISGLIGKLGVNKTGETYVSGFKEMIFAAMIIGLANSISLILKEGMVIDSIVYGLFGPLKSFSPAFSGVLMMISHVILHFPLPSYSGQAVMTMPILVPLSDLIGMSRQTCVLAYQYGAVMADMIVPTNGALMAVLAINGISYNKWFKFAIKPTLLILLIGAIAIVAAVTMGYR
ncbi:putative ion transporter superfamily protein YfcC [Saonia flava]|uniref:Putative ion transporter superfamily protein YfcC n=1 Tax=Saonia flava TaxID=523696 RepID=A0A846QP65_9FLAO|nr:YfcC family protein [Saonia flava]NJB69861.1 putative ion transporter superfamily protein YfcC [Saonia flava]